MISLSVVVPAYNVELYLAKCLDSILCQNQTSHPIEIIIVDDGSKDSTLSIAKSYEQKFSNIKLISQLNQGLSVARNNGLKIATGDYVWFIDSDDWIKPNSFEKLLDICKQFLPDMISIGRIVVKNDIERQIGNSSIHKQRLITGEICLKENCFEIPAQLFLFERQFLLQNELSFAVGKLHEDKDFTPRAVYFSKKFYYSNQYLYCHLQRPGSITAVPNPKRCLDLMEISENTYDFSKLHNMSLDSQRIFARHAFFSLTLAAILALKLVDKKRKKSIFKKLRSYMTLFYDVFKHDKVIYKIEVVVFFISPRLFAFLYQIKGGEH